MFLEKLKKNDYSSAMKTGRSKQEGSRHSGICFKAVKGTEYLLGMNIRRYILILIAVCAVFSCKKTDGPVIPEEYADVNVAVILPMDSGLDRHWSRTLEMCSENVRKATLSAGAGIRINFKFYDERTPELAALVDSITAGGETDAVIGGLYSSSAKIIASRLVRHNIPLFTLATTEQLVRSYSGWGNLWAMTETDVTQCEVLLSKAALYGAKSVALLTRDDDAYCQTFIDWFAFQADELGLQTKGQFTYASADEALMEDAFASGADCVICVPADVEDIAPMLRARYSYQKSTGVNVRTLFSDTAYGADVIPSLGELGEGLEGVTFGADPESGFEVSYKVRFGVAATLGEAQVYDACMLIGLASMMQQLEVGLYFREAMQRLVSGRGRKLGGWMLEDMALCAQDIASGGSPDISGASGSLNFDSKVYTNVLATIYYNYIIYNGQYVVIDYNSTDGSKRTDPTMAGWNWKAQHMQEFGPVDDITYPQLDKRWALIVATSSGWDNYRHQADALNMYQIFKRYGYTDDRIVLIVEDDIAHDPQNLYPGVVRSRIGGENVRAGAVIDYHTSDLSPSDLGDILLGKRSARLREVIEADGDDNVIIFWSGHGKPTGLEWMQDGVFTLNQASQLFSQLEQAGSYRRLLWLVETCYSGGVAQAVEGKKGMLSISAANAYETSKADIYDPEMDVWLSNRFTATFQDAVEEDSSIIMCNLYYKLFQNTVGSHVCVYNAENYGNLYTSNMGDYLEAPLK